MTDQASTSTRLKSPLRRGRQKSEEQVAVAPPLTLMWWKFRKHKMALISAVVSDPAVPDGDLLRVRGALRPG